MTVLPPIPPSPRQRLLTSPFRLAPVPAPWAHAFRYALAMGTPVLIGVLLGNTAYGMLAALGGFSALYGKSLPYFLRAAAVAAAAAGLALSMAAGTLAAPWPWLSVLAIGSVAGVSTLVCSALGSTKPGAIFFPVLCAIGTGLPPDPSETPLRAGLIAAGGACAWLIVMSGWLVNPRGPEQETVAAAFRAVAAYLATIGTERDRIRTARHQAATAMQSAWDAVIAPGPRTAARSTRLARVVRLLREANELFLLANAMVVRRCDPLPDTVPAVVAAVGDTVGDARAARLIVVPDTGDTAQGRVLRVHLEAAVATAVTQGSEPQGQPVTPQPILQTIRAAVGPDSLVAPFALRVALTTGAGAAVGYLLRLERPYWVPLTIAIVLQGQNLMSTAQRALERALGTAAGVVLGGALLALAPGPIAVVFVLMGLVFANQLVQPRNFAAATLFMTPLALILTEARGVGPSGLHLMGLRLVDTVIGCVIALIGGFLLWPAASTARLPTMIGRAVRAEGRLLHAVLEAGSTDTPAVRQARYATRTAIINLRAVYDQAIGERPGHRPEVEALWPAVVRTERLGYTVMAEHPDPAVPTMTPEDLARLDTAFDTMVAMTDTVPRAPTVRRRPWQARLLWHRIRQQPALPPLDLPELPTHPRLAAEMVALHESLTAERPGPDPEEGADPPGGRSGGPAADPTSGKQA